RPAGASVPAIASVPALLRVMRGQCGPLAHLHARGVVHRDLKPDNVVLRDDGAPIIIDFGVATRSGVAHGREELVADGGAAGTCLYMAPEQIRDEDVDARADLYALGCIL